MNEYLLTAARATRTAGLICLGVVVGASVGITSAQERQINALDNIIHQAEPVYCVRPLYYRGEDE